jgi:hypothetical protein
MKFDKDFFNKSEKGMSEYRLGVSFNDGIEFCKPVKWYKMSREFKIGLLWFILGAITMFGVIIWLTILTT